MKKFNNLFLISCFICVFLSYDLSSQNSKLPKYFYKRFEGKINNKYELVINLIRDEKQLRGSIYFNNGSETKEYSFGMNCSIKGNSFYLELNSFDKNDNEKEILNGKFINEAEISGYYFIANSKMKLKFYAKEKYPQGSFQYDLIKKQKRIVNGKTYISFTFPISNDFEIINSYVMNSMLNNPFAPDIDRKFQTLDEVIDYFIKDFDENKNKMKNNYPDYDLPWEQEMNINVLFNEKSLLSLEFFIFNFSGGAHPNTNISFVNFNLKTQKEISVRDIFISDYENKLRELGEKKFRMKFNLKDYDNLNEAGFFFNNNEFKLNENFLMCKNGIRFLFNQYEVAAYSFGQISIYFKYSELRELLNKDFINKLGLEL